MNQLQLSGTIDNHPEFRETKNSLLCKFVFAHVRTIRDKNTREDVDVVDRWLVEAWGYEADRCRILERGDFINASFELRQEHWVNTDGKECFKPVIRLFRFDGPFEYVRRAAPAAREEHYGPPPSYGQPFKG